MQKIWVSFPPSVTTIHRTIKYYKPPLHTHSNHTANSAENDLLLWIKYLEDKNIPSANSKKSEIYKKVVQVNKTLTLVSLLEI